MDAESDRGVLDAERWARAEKAASALPADSALTRSGRLTVAGALVGLIYGVVGTVLNVFARGFLDVGDVARTVVAGVLTLGLLTLMVVRLNRVGAQSTVLAPLTAAQRREVRRQAYEREAADPAQLTVTRGFARQARQLAQGQLPSAGFWCCLAAFETSYSTSSTGLFWVGYVTLIVGLVVGFAVRYQRLGRFLEEHADVSVS